MDPSGAKEIGEAGDLAVWAVVLCLIGGGLFCGGVHEHAWHELQSWIR
jgi:hypothetical protein